MAGHGVADFGSGAGRAASAATLSWVPHTPEPWKLYATVAVNTSDADHAVGVLFTIERGIMNLLRPGDCLHLHAENRWIGLSVVRDGRLLAAAGAAIVLAAMPLGDVRLRLPDPTAVPRNTWRCLCTDEPRRVEAPVRPVEISTEGTTITRWNGRPTVGRFDVLFRCGPDDEPWLSFEWKGMCPETAAHTTAELLVRDGLAITRTRSAYR